MHAVRSLEPTEATERYSLSLARDLDQVRAAQRLRFEVFNLEFHEGLAEAHLTGLDADAFDPVCDHLLVSERDTGRVVGTYRLQSGTSAGQNLGYYGEREFDFTPFEAARGEIVELGRACVAATHRNQVVLGLLWRGIARYAAARGARYLVGCSSVASLDEGAALATYRMLAPTALVAPPWRTLPQPDWRCQENELPSDPLPIPRLMRAYLALGARICGEPALDREFGTVDFLTWLDLRTLPPRVLKHFLGE